MIKEILKQNDLNETQKIMNAIHTQAYWKNKEDENKRMLKNMDKALKPKKSKIKEVLLRECEIALLLVISTPGIIALILLFKCLTK